MLKTAKVFIILGMIFQFYLIFPIILGVLALSKLKEAKTANDLKGYGIVCLILVNTIAGILMLCAKDEDVYEYQQSLQSSHEGNFKESNDVYENLEALKDLYDRGIIDEKTYFEKRQKYIDQL